MQLRITMTHLTKHLDCGPVSSITEEQEHHQYKMYKTMSRHNAEKHWGISLSIW